MNENDVMDLLARRATDWPGPVTIESASEDDIERFEQLHSFVFA